MVLRNGLVEGFLSIQNWRRENPVEFVAARAEVNYGVALFVLK
jgi:hypothetical protein